MKTLTQLVSASAMALALAAPAAHAIVVSGSFSGLAEARYPYGESLWPFRGSFQIETDTVVPPEDIYASGTTTSWLLPEGSASIELTLDSGDFDLRFGGSWPLWLTVTNEADAQHLSISGGDLFSSASLYLVGAPGSLMRGDDLRSFGPGPIDLARSSAYAFGHQFSADGALTAFRFDTPTAPVPEPATWAAMLLGLGGLGLWRRRGARAAPLGATG